MTERYIIICLLLIYSCKVRGECLEPNGFFHSIDECPVCNGTIVPCICEGGFYKTVDNPNTCFPCDTGYFCPGGFQQKIPCPENSNSEAGVSDVASCSCSDGYYRKVGQTCEPCQQDHFCRNGGIMTCPVLSGSAPKSSLPSNCTCLPGAVASNTGCVICQEDNFCEGGTRINACPQFSHSLIGSKTIHDCQCVLPYIMIHRKSLLSSNYSFECVHFDASAEDDSLTALPSTSVLGLEATVEFDANDLTSIQKKAVYIYDDVSCLDFMGFLSECQAKIQGAMIDSDNIVLHMQNILLDPVFLYLFFEIFRYATLKHSMYTQRREVWFSGFSTSADTLPALYQKFTLRYAIQSSVDIDNFQPVLSSVRGAVSVFAHQKGAEYAQAIIRSEVVSHLGSLRVPFSWWNAERGQLCLPGARNGVIIAGYIDIGVHACPQWSVMACLVQELGALPAEQTIECYLHMDILQSVSKTFENITDLLIPVEIFDGFFQVVAEREAERIHFAGKIQTYATYSEIETDAAQFIAVDIDPASVIFDTGLQSSNFWGVSIPPNQNLDWNLALLQANYSSVWRAFEANSDRLSREYGLFVLDVLGHTVHAGSRYHVTGAQNAQLTVSSSDPDQGLTFQVTNYVLGKQDLSEIMTTLSRFSASECTIRNITGSVQVSMEQSHRILTVEDTETFADINCSVTATATATFPETIPYACDKKSYTIKIRHRFSLSAAVVSAFLGDVFRSLLLPDTEGVLISVQEDHTGASPASMVVVEIPTGSVEDCTGSYSTEMDTIKMVVESVLFGVQIEEVEQACIIKCENKTNVMHKNQLSNIQAEDGVNLTLDCNVSATQQFVLPNTQDQFFEMIGSTSMLSPEKNLQGVITTANIDTTCNASDLVHVFGLLNTREYLPQKVSDSHHLTEWAAGWSASESEECVQKGLISMACKREILIEAVHHARCVNVTATNGRLSNARVKNFVASHSRNILAQGSDGLATTHVLQSDFWGITTQNFFSLQRKYASLYNESGLEHRDAHVVTHVGSWQWSAPFSDAVERAEHVIFSRNRPAGPSTLAITYETQVYLYTRTAIFADSEIFHDLSTLMLILQTLLTNSFAVNDLVVKNFSHTAMSESVYLSALSEEDLMNIHDLSRELVITVHIQAKTPSTCSTIRMSIDDLFPSSILSHNLTLHQIPNLHKCQSMAVHRFIDESCETHPPPYAGTRTASSCFQGEPALQLRVTSNDPFSFFQTLDIWAADVAAHDLYFEHRMQVCDSNSPQKNQFLGIDTSFQYCGQQEYTCAQPGHGCVTYCAQQENISTMCQGRRRPLETPDRMSGGVEMCHKSSVCSHIAIWDPLLYPDVTGLPAGGIYCTETCENFDVPDGYKMQECTLQKKSKCSSGDVVRCPGAICVDKQESPGYECVCDGKMSKLNDEGSDCTANVAVIIVRVRDYAPLPNATLMSVLGRQVLQQALEGDYLRNYAIQRLIPVSVSRVNAEERSRQWNVALKIPMYWLDIEKINAHAFFFGAVLNETVMRFENFEMISYDIKSMQSTDSVDVSGGYEVTDWTWKSSSPQGMGWEITMQVSVSDNSIPFLYVSKQGADGNVLGSNVMAIPCRIAERTANGACCMQEFSEIYHTTQSFYDKTNCSTNDHLKKMHDSQALLGGNLFFNTSSSASTKIISHGVLEVSLFLELTDVQHSFGSSYRGQFGEWHIIFFVGIGNIRLFSDAMALSGTHTMFEAEIDISHTFTSSMTVTDTFTPRINIEILRVQGFVPGEYHDFARLQIYLDDPNMRFIQDNAIPRESALFWIAYTVDSSEIYYSCAGYNASAFDAFRSTSGDKCAFKEEICTGIFNAQANSMVYIFPLGINALSPALSLYDVSSVISQKLYFDFILNMRNVEENKNMYERISTVSEITWNRLALQCSNAEISASLFDTVRMDIVGGLLEDPTDINSTVSYFKDIKMQVTDTECDEKNPETRCMQTPKLGMGSITMLLLGEDDAFSVNGKTMFNIRADTVFSIYFLSELKKLAVKNLISKQRAFVFRPGETMETATSLNPSEELLKICPLALVPGSYGCISRYEIENGVLDFQTSSIAEFHPDRSNTTIYDAALQDWVHVAGFGTSEYAEQIVNNHAKIVSREFSINDRYRKAFLVSPQLPWLERELKAENITSFPETVQDTMTFVLAEIDSEFHSPPKASHYTLNLLVKVPMNCSIFSTSSVLQDMYKDTFGYTLGINHAMISLSHAESATADECLYHVNIELPYSKKDRALVQGTKMTQKLSTPKSVLSMRIKRSLMRRISDLEARSDISLLHEGISEDSFEVVSVALATNAETGNYGMRRLLFANTQLSANPMIDNKNQTRSEFIVRRYKNTNGADVLTRMISSRIQNQQKDAPVGEKNTDKDSRMAMLEMRIKPEIACSQNETLIMNYVQSSADKGISGSASTSLSRVTPTAFVVLDDDLCNSYRNGGQRRLLQTQQSVTTYLEMVFTRKPTPITADPGLPEENIIITPSDVFLIIPPDVTLVRVVEVPTDVSNSTAVIPTWGLGNVFFPYDTIIREPIKKLQIYEIFEEIVFRDTIVLFAIILLLQTIFSCYFDLFNDNIDQKGVTFVPPQPMGNETCYSNELRPLMCDEAVQNSPYVYPQYVLAQPPAQSQFSYPLTLVENQDPNYPQGNYIMPTQTGLPWVNNRP